MQNRIVYIDSNNLQAHALLVADFLQKSAEQYDYLHLAGLAYPLSNNQHYDKIVFSHHILARQCNHHPSLYRWELFRSEDILFQSNNSVIFFNVGTVALKANQQLMLKPPRYIIKMQVHGIYNDSSKLQLLLNKFNIEKLNPIGHKHVQQEVNHSKEAGLKMKTEVELVYDEASISFIVSERLQGEELFYFLNKDQDKKNLTVDERLALTLNILQTYKHQVADLQIVHRDIKSENIMRGENNQLRIIDYAFSKFYEEKDSAICGTPDYIAPEVVRGENADIKADIYSLGEVLQWLWHVNPRKVWVDDFIKLPKLDKKEIAHLLVAMKCDDKNKRPNLLEVINKFSHIQLKNELKLVDLEQHQAIRNADEVASLTSIILDDLVVENYLAKRSQPEWQFAEIKKVINSALEEIEDKPLAIQRFVSRLNIKQLNDAKSKLKMTNIIDQMEIELKKTINMLFNIHAMRARRNATRDDAQLNQYDELQIKLDHKIGRVPLTFDRIHLLLQKFKFAINNNKKLLETINEKYPVRVSLDALQLENPRAKSGIYSTPHPLFFACITNQSQKIKDCAFSPRFRTP